MASGSTAKALDSLRAVHEILAVDISEATPFMRIEWRNVIQQFILPTSTTSFF